MGLTESVFGTPGQTQIHQTGGTKPPGYGFAKDFANWLPQLMQQQFPGWGGNFDPGMSPTMQDALRRAQGYAQSGPSEIMQGVQGTLGGFMSPNFMNPWNSLFGGSPNYGGVDSAQRVYGGGPANGMTFQGSPGQAPGQPGGQPEVQPPGAAGNAPWRQAAMRRPDGSLETGGFVNGQWQPNPGGGPTRSSWATSPTPMPPGGMAGSPPPPQLPGGGAAPGGANPFQAGADQAAGALIKQYGGRGNLLNPLQGQYGTGDQFTQGFMHSSDHQAALRQLLGREPTFDEVQKSWRSGSGNIEAARNSYMAEGVPADRRDGWTPDTYALKNAIDQNGLLKGQQMFDQAPGAAPGAGVPPPSPAAPAPATPQPMPSTPTTTPPPPRTFQGRPVTTQNGVEGIVGAGGRFQPIGGGRGAAPGRPPIGPTDMPTTKPVPPRVATPGDGRPGRAPGAPGGPTDVPTARPMKPGVGIYGGGATDVPVAKPIPDRTRPRQVRGRGPGG